jgi:hypothetical protein
MWQVWLWGAVDQINYTDSVKIMELRHNWIRRFDKQYVDQGRWRKNWIATILLTCKYKDWLASAVPSVLT